MNDKLWFAPLLLGLIALAVAHFGGLVLAPTEAMMGEVGRILYAHVPTAWTGMLVGLVAFVFACGSLATSKDVWDLGTHASVEVGTLLCTLLCIQGALWAKPTWGVYWDWDPRLTSTAILVLSFAGVLILRALVHDATKRRIVTGVTTILAFVNVPITYYSVKWWNTLHQDMSSSNTIADEFKWSLYLGWLGMMLIAAGLIGLRTSGLMAAMRREHGETALPDAKQKIELLAEKGGV
jgi:heme exporter protein C